MKPGAVVAVVVLLTAPACVRHVSPEERGAELVADPRFSDSSYNAFACTTCHAIRPGEQSERIWPGAPLAGATRRPSFWGGRVHDLFEAVSLCYRRFMLGGMLARDSDDSVALYAYLESLSATGPAITHAVPFTVPPGALVPEPGDPRRGAVIYTRACRYCHGEPRSGSGRLSSRVAVVPDETEMQHTRSMGYTQDTLRQVFVEKIRHGNFLGLAGTMPPFSQEVLSDQDVFDIVAYLNPRLRD